MELSEQGINNVKMVAIGKEQYSNYNSDWTENNILPVVMDTSPIKIWDNWGASQRDLFFIDSNGNYFTDFNISQWDYNSIYNTIMELIEGCADPSACNYHPHATLNNGCFYAQNNFDCEGSCLESVGADCLGVCGGGGQLDACGNCNGGITDIAACQDTGCIEEIACNYNPNAIVDSGNCTYPEDNYDCNGACITDIDCTGICGGTISPNIECTNSDDLVCSPIDCQPLNTNNSIIPKEFEITSIYPNPFNPTTTINYILDKNNYIKLMVFDIRGREIATLFNNFQIAGRHMIKWDALYSPSGVYFIMLQSDNFQQTQKILLIK